MSPSTKRNLIISCVLTLVAGGLFGLMFMQTQAQATKLETQIATLAEQRAQEASYFRLQKIAEETKEERAQLANVFLLKESDSIDFLNEIEAIAPTAGVSLQTSNLSLVTDATDSSSWIEVTFSFSGSRQRVTDFIAVLEVVPYVSRLTDLSLSANDEGQWVAKATMRVKVLAYDS